ncbi:hypothetical protein Tco_1409920 [Tanacetum coccineum]
MSNTNMQTQTSNALHNAIMEAGGKDRPPMLAPVPVAEGSSETTTERYMENYKNVSQDIRDQLNAKAEAKAIERLKQGESINVQDLETNLYWEFGKFTSRDGKSLESYYSRFYKMMNELVRNQCNVTNHQVNFQFLLQLQPEWQRTSRLEMNTDEESERSELGKHNILHGQIQEVTPDQVDNSGPIFDAGPLHKVQNNTDNYNVFAIENEHPEQPESVNDIYLEEQGDTNITIDSLESNFQAELDKYHDVNYASKMEIHCAKSKGDLMSYKIEFEKSSNEYTRKINDLNQTISDMKKELFAHQETISIMSQEKEAQIKLYKTHEDKELDKVIALENKVKCKEKVKNDKSFKENQSKEFLKEREQYFEIQDLKAQLQDKGIAISELKKLIEKMKGKYVETNFEKSSVIRQPNAFKSQRQPVLGKPAIFLDSLKKKDFSKSKSVTKNNVSNDFSKRVNAQILPQNIKSILKNTNHSIKSKRIGENRDIPNNKFKGMKQEEEDHRRNFNFSNNKTSVTACNDSLNAKTSNVNFVCVTCGKYVLNDNHDLCVLHYINGVNSRTRQPIDVPISTREPKHNVNQSVATSHKKTVAPDSYCQET